MAIANVIGSEGKFDDPIASRSRTGTPDPLSPLLRCAEVVVVGAPRAAFVRARPRSHRARPPPAAMGARQRRA